MEVIQQKDKLSFLDKIRSKFPNVMTYTFWSPGHILHFQAVIRTDFTALLLIPCNNSSMVSIVLLQRKGKAQIWLLRKWSDVYKIKCSLNESFLKRYHLVSLLIFNWNICRTCKRIYLMICLSCFKSAVKMWPGDEIIRSNYNIHMNNFCW